MLHIILLIFKIIGITLLVIIGLLLLILLIILLVPIRYRAEVAHGEALYAEGRVSWLLHIIGAKITYLEGKLHIRIRVLWITLYDNLMPEKPKIKKTKRKTAINKKKTGKKVVHKEIHKPSDQIKPSGQVLKKEITEKSADIPTKVLPNPASAPETPTLRKEVVQDIEHTNKVNVPEITQSTTAQDSQGDEEEQKSLFHKFTSKIINIKDRIFAFFKGMKNKILGWFDTIINMKHKIGLILAFLQDEYNKEGFHITFASLKKLLKHVLPTKLKSRLVFGTGDPCSTGQALGLMGILYSFYGDKIVIVPDFENKRLEGKHFAKGRIRLVTVLIIVFKLLFDKRFKHLKNNFQILKEAL